MNISNIKMGLLGGLFLVLAAPSANALTYTIDTEGDLTSNFNLDVVSGDVGSRFRNGYAADGAFPGSDGGFVTFDNYTEPNSIQFASGPVTLNSFQISSQYNLGGDGVSDAIEAGHDYRLVFYDELFNSLYDQVLTVAAGGIWETQVFNLENVSTIWIDMRSDGVIFSEGWWPNLDNITVNEPISAVPVPAALPLFGTGLAALGFLGWRRKRKTT